MPLRKEWEHAAKLYEKGGAGTGKVWIRKETNVREFEPVSNWATADLIRGIAFEGDQQTPEMIESEVRDPDQRKAQDKIAGPIDHVERTLRMEVRPPGALAGSDTIMGAAVMEGVCGDESETIPNTQTAEAIIAVNGHSATSTILDLGGVVVDYPLGSVWALRSGETKTAHADHQPAVITAVTFLDPNCRVTFEPPFFVEPTTSDTVEGGVSWIPQTSFDDTYSVVTEQGFDGDQFRGGVFPSCSITIDRRGLLIVEAAYHAIQSYFSAFGYIHGEGGLDDLQTDDTELDVENAELYTVGSFLKFEKWNISTGVMDDDEDEIEVTDRDISSAPNTITVTRGSGPISVTGGANDLQAESDETDAIDISAGITLSSESIVLELDGRGQVTIPLSDGSTQTADDIVADIHAALKYEENYGLLTDVPFAAAVNYGTGVASKVSDKLHLASKAYGSQSQVKAVRTAATATTFDKIWTGAATLEYLADFEVQITPWTPGGSVSVNPVPNWEGLGNIAGKKFKFISATASFDNNVEFLEDVRTGDQYAEGHAEGAQRNAEIAVTSPQYGWVAMLKDLAARDQTVSVGLWTGAAVGKTFSIFALRAKPSASSKSGDTRVEGAYTLLATDPELGSYDSSIPELIFGLT